MNLQKNTNKWNGYCPESMLKGKTVRMRLNEDDLFESEETGLQILVLKGVQAIILHTRGNGQFKVAVSYADEISEAELLSPQNTEIPPFNQPAEIFTEPDDLNTFISGILK